MAHLALAYGLMACTLYTAAFAEKKWHSMARILVCGTVTCVGLGQMM